MDITIALVQTWAAEGAEGGGAVAEAAEGGGAVATYILEKTVLLIYGTR